MTVDSTFAWAGMLVLVLLASSAGCALASFAPWRPSLRDGGLPGWSGLALAPLLLGMAAVAVLALAPGASHGVHLAGACAILAVPIVLALARRQAWWPKASGLRTPDHLLLALLLAWLAGLLLNAVFIPLTQNDALEYATVGRILFDSRSLWSYPAIHPEQTAGGFYGPWTHPPLYVALIYLVSAVQGHAHEPGLMRLLAPWTLAVAAGLTYACGSLLGRRAGLLAALVLLACPLLFLGAESALIDALPVLGLLLVLVAIVGLQGPALARGAAAGVALGLALWTHSQAVLFVPLAMAAVLAATGLGAWREVLRTVAAMLGVAAAIACWPYLRNLALFGSAISDNPVVFALPQQAWPDYFTIARGIDHWAAIVQYGWFKGWFAPEAYGLAFWLMLPGLWLVLRRRRALPESAAPMLRVVVAVLALYLAGVVASTLLGLDLMIKNERYLLVVLPLVALLAGLALDRALAWRPLLVLPLAVVAVAQLSVLVGYRFLGNGLTPARVGQPFEATLRQRPEYRVVEFLRRSTPQSALVLSLKPADMYYAQRRMLSYLDPRLVPFYGAATAAAAYAQLVQLGVTHVHVPDYGLPPLHNSPLPAVLHEPRWAQLVAQADGNQVYALRAAALERGPALDLLDAARWSRSSGLVVGGRKALASLAQAPQPADPRAPHVTELPGGWFHREISTLLTAGADPGAGAIPVRGDVEYALDLQLRGHGLVRVWLQQFGADGAALRGEYLRSQSRFQLTDLVLGGTYPQRRLLRRLHTHPQAARLVLSLEQVGHSTLQVEQAQLVGLRRADAATRSGATP